MTIEVSQQDPNVHYLRTGELRLAMKIRPTTPQHPLGRYQTIQIIIFSDPTWTEPDTFQRYVGSETELSPLSPDHEFRQQFEASVRAGYRKDESGQAGWIGPWNRRQSTDRTLTMQWIFQEPWPPS